MVNICSQSNVIFNSIIQNGGSNPAFQWRLNNINTGNGNASYSNSNMVPGDSISCEMTSNVPCFSSPIVSSNTITMTCVTSITLNLKELPKLCVWASKFYSVGAAFCTEKSGAVVCTAAGSSAEWVFGRTSDCDPNPALTPD